MANAQSRDLRAELEMVDPIKSTNRDNVNVQIAVYEGEGRLGDFFVTFTRKQIGGERAYTADRSDVQAGNGLYGPDSLGSPPWWAVEDVVENLEEKYELRSFRAIETGPNDK